MLPTQSQPLLDMDMAVDMDIFKILIAIESDKMELITGKYTFLPNNVYLHFYVSYKNSLSFSKISINFYMVMKNLNNYHVHRKSYKISNFEIMVKN